MRKVLKKKTIKPKLNKYNKIRINFIGDKPVIKYEMVSTQQIRNAIEALSEWI